MMFLINQVFDLHAFPELICTEQFCWSSGTVIRLNMRIAASAHRSRERLTISKGQLNTEYKPITQIRNSFTKCQSHGGVDNVNVIQHATAGPGPVPVLLLEVFCINFPYFRTFLLLVYFSVNCAISQRACGSQIQNFSMMEKEQSSRVVVVVVVVVFLVPFHSFKKCSVLENHFK